MGVGSGGAPEGVLAAAALQSIGGQIQGQLLFRNDDERGRAADAALVMQELTDEPAYQRVQAPQAISRLANGQEQFSLNIQVGEKIQAGEEVRQ